MRFQWKKIGLPCLIIHDSNDILPVKLPKVSIWSETEESTVVADDR